MDKPKECKACVIEYIVRGECPMKFPMPMCFTKEYARDEAKRFGPLFHNTYNGGSQTRPNNSRSGGT